MLLALSPAVCATILTRHGREAQKQQWLPGLASGERVIAFAITEPDAESNTHRIRTSAARVGDSWRLDGGKYYVSHVDNAQAILVVARTNQPDAASGRRTARGSGAVCRGRCQPQRHSDRPTVRGDARAGGGTRRATSRRGSPIGDGPAIPLVSPAKLARRHRWFLVRDTLLIHWNPVGQAA